MSVEDLNRVHRRYIRVSNTFKSAWTFHQFIQGVHKVFTDLEGSDYPGDFQTVYGDLKEVSKSLSETDAEKVGAMLDRAEEKLAPLSEGLLAADAHISPALLRLFFQRVKNYDDNILTQLVKFYLYSRDGEGWDVDRLDKADYLATKVAEEYHDGRNTYVLRDPSYVREVAEGFWAALEAESPVDDQVVEVREQIRLLASELAAIDSIDELHRQALISRYRDLKHGLQDLFFQPKVLPAILAANLELKNHIQRLYRREEERIVAEYQQIFELEREVPIDKKLHEELSEFRAEVERFEEQLQGENVRLDDLASLRERVRGLLPRLQPDAGPPPASPSLSGELEDLLGEPAPRAAPAAGAPRIDPYVEERFEEIVAALDDTDASLPPSKVALQPEIFTLGVHAREVLAYRRLYGDKVCDRELEQFVLEAAALRSRIEAEVDDIKGILDDSSVTREAPVFLQGRQTVRRADLYLRRFDHRLELAVLDGDLEEARALQYLKVRMMRGYSGLWLLLYTG